MSWDYNLCYGFCTFTKLEGNAGTLSSCILENVGFIIFGAFWDFLDLLSLCCFDSGQPFLSFANTSILDVQHYISGVLLKHIAANNPGIEGTLHCIRLYLAGTVISCGEHSAADAEVLFWHKIVSVLTLQAIHTFSPASPPAHFQLDISLLVQNILLYFKGCYCLLCFMLFKTNVMPVMGTRDNIPFETAAGVYENMILNLSKAKQPTTFSTCNFQHTAGCFFLQMI